MTSSEAASEDTHNWLSALENQRQKPSFSRSSRRALHDA